MPVTHEVPSRLIMFPFYKIGDTLTVQNYNSYVEQPPFYNEWLFYTQSDTGRKQWPWQTENELDGLWTTWEMLRSQPEDFFRKRKPKLAEPYMIQLTATLISYLFWSVGEPVDFREQGLQSLSDLAVAPVNVVERLQFITTSPSQYHAFVQLNELYNEAKKKRALYKIKRNG